MKTRFILLSIMTTTLCMPLSAAADILLGANNGTGQLVQIDTVTSTTSNLGALSAVGPDLELSPDGTTLVGVTTAGVVNRFNAADGSDIGSIAIAFSPGALAAVNPDTATALEYVGAVLYAAFDQSGPETLPGYFGTLDPVTGATTDIGLLAGMNAPTGGLAYDGAIMYAVSSANSVNSELYTINLATGAATLIAPITLGGNPVEAMTALTIEGGVAYTKSNDTTGGTSTTALYRLDLTTGALTLVFDMGVSVVSLTSAGAVLPPTAAQPVPSLSLWALFSLIGLMGLIGHRNPQLRRKL